MNERHLLFEGVCFVYDRNPESVRTVVWVCPAGRDSAPARRWPAACSKLGRFLRPIGVSTSPNMTPNRYAKVVANLFCFHETGV